MNAFVKILLISLFVLLLPIFLVSDGLFGNYSFAAIGFILILYYPLCAIGFGIYSGMQMKVHWKIIFIFPLIFSVLFFFIFRVDEFVFSYFPIGYFVLSGISMILVDIIKKKK